MFRHLRVVLALFLIAFFGLPSYLWMTIQAEQKLALETAVKESVLNIENRLSGNEDYIQLLSQMRVRKEISTADFEDQSLPYLQQHPELINFTWVDAARYIRGVSPLRGNSQAIGLYLDLPEPTRVSKLAEKTKTPQYTNAFEAIQGDCSFQVWAPVYDNGAFDGLFAGAYSCQRLLENALPSSMLEQYSIAITDRSGAILAEKTNTGAKLSSVKHAHGFNVNNNMQLVMKRYQQSFWDVNFITLLVSGQLHYN